MPVLGMGWSAVEGVGKKRGSGSDPTLKIGNWGALRDENDDPVQLEGNRVQRVELKFEIHKKRFLAKTFHLGSGPWLGVRSDWLTCQ